MDIGAEIDKLKPKSKKRFMSTLFRSIAQLHHSLMLRGPYRLVIDSNVLMRLEGYKNGEIKEGLLAILLFFKLLKRLPFHIDVVVLPSVFYEYLRKKNLESTKEHWENFKEVKDLVEGQFNLVLFFDGIETFTAADEYIKKIRNDEEILVRVLREYEERSWKVEYRRTENGHVGIFLSEGMIEVCPLYAAVELYQELQFEYLDADSMRLFFIEHIDRKINECVDNDKRMVQKYADGHTYMLARILRLSGKGELLGLGDADIFSRCNINNQFSLQAHGRYQPASIALTLDEGLLKALDSRTSQVISSGEVRGGEVNQADAYAKLEAYHHDRRRLAEGVARENQAKDIIREFLAELDGGYF